MAENKFEWTTRNKGILAGAAVLLILVLSFAFLAFGGKKPAPDYTGLWETHDKQWVYVDKGEIDTDYTGAVTGLIDRVEDTYYVNHGEVDLGYTGLGASEEGWVYFSKGVLDDTFTGFAQGGSDWYWVDGGAVDQTYTGVRQGTINGETTWWRVEDGRADPTYSGVTKTKEGIWVFKNGKLDSSYNGIQKLNSDWLYFTKGKQDKNYKGVALNENGIWYVQNGKVDFDYNGKVTHLGRTYKVKGGVVGNGKAVYLTFDDGPGQYTEELLGILAHHKVKATFFVTGFFKNYLDCLEKEAKAGHTIGVHTYTHDYEKIYKSEKAYWDDFEQMEKVIEQHTGKRVNVFRFPGGSSNAISKKYKEGIMTDLVKTANKKGLVYFDWNVLSGDSGNTKDSDKIYKNIVKGCARHTYSVVLCHDIHDFTVNAMDKTIAKLLKEGYVILPLDATSPTVHQHVNN
ncbi:MAG: polysaccharide deacetylase [Clostridia bacterium]|nr:polysaccharide deacetylase [Clostridia bacterium]